jgi:hypothetical protein
VQRLAVIARLKPDTSAQAAALLAGGPPFDPAAAGLERHTVYLSHAEAVFVFEGPEVEWVVDAIIDDPFRPSAFGAWQDLLDGPPRLAHPEYAWERDEGDSRRD